jgi:hypothetical protein
VKELFNIVGRFHEKNSIKSSEYVGECTNAARVMAGSRGLQAFIKQLEPEAMWTHCMIHHESLATQELCPD